MQPMGKTQHEVLKKLVKSGRWNITMTGEWVWDTPSRTISILEALVKRGHVIKISRLNSPDTYEPATVQPQIEEVNTKECAWCDKTFFKKAAESKKAYAERQTCCATCGSLLRESQKKRRNIPLMNRAFHFRSERA